MLIVVCISLCRMRRCCTVIAVPTASSHERYVCRKLCVPSLPMPARTSPRELGHCLPGNFWVPHPSVETQNGPEFDPPAAGHADYFSIAPPLSLCVGRRYSFGMYDRRMPNQVFLDCSKGLE